MMPKGICLNLLRQILTDPIYIEELSGHTTIRAGSLHMPSIIAMVLRKKNGQISDMTIRAIWQVM